jgi:hypothetical protein
MVQIWWKMAKFNVKWSNVMKKGQILWKMVKFYEKWSTLFATKHTLSNHLWIWPLVTKFLRRGRSREPGGRRHLLIFWGIGCFLLSICCETNRFGRNSSEGTTRVDFTNSFWNYFFEKRRYSRSIYSNFVNVGSLCMHGDQIGGLFARGQKSCINSDKNGLGYIL